MVSSGKKNYKYFIGYKDVIIELNHYAQYFQIQALMLKVMIVKLNG